MCVCVRACVRVCVRVCTCVCVCVCVCVQPHLSGKDLHSLGDFLLSVHQLHDRVKLQPEGAVEVLSVLRGLFKFPRQLVVRQVQHDVLCVCGCVWWVGVGKIKFELKRGLSQYETIKHKHPFSNK